MRYGTTDQMSPRIYPWWLILVGFVFGVIVTLVVTASHPQQPTTIYQPYDNQEMQSFEMTATGIVREATLNAQTFKDEMAFPTENDPIFLTATAIIVQATQAAPFP